MKVLKLTRMLMKLCGALPIFDSSFEGKCLESLKQAILLICQIFVTISTFLYFTLSPANFSLMTTAMYICIGYVLGILMHISLFFQTDRTIRLLQQLETLVNTRKKSQFMVDFTSIDGKFVSHRNCVK